MIYGPIDDEIKNYWNSHLRHQLCSMGTNPSCDKVSLMIGGCSSSELLAEGAKEEDGSTSSRQGVTTRGWDTYSPLESSSTTNFNRANHSEVDNLMSQDEVYASNLGCNRREDKKSDMTSHGDCILAAPPFWPITVTRERKQGHSTAPIHQKVFFPTLWQVLPKIYCHNLNQTPSTLWSSMTEHVVAGRL